MRAVHNPMTTEPPPRLTTRILLGAIAGFVATAAMTAAMARLHRRLPEIIIHSLVDERPVVVDPQAKSPEPFFPGLYIFLS